MIDNGPEEVLEAISKLHEGDHGLSGFKTYDSTDDVHPAARVLHWSSRSTVNVYLEVRNSVDLGRLYLTNTEDCVTGLATHQ